MANEEHLRIIKKGVEAWNNWRREKGSAAPDLSAADLRIEYLPYADLSHSDLSAVDLTRATLRWAEFTMANLSKAHLSGSDLHGANLSGANLTLAHLSGADLSHAMLNGTKLSRATLREAYIREANLTGADLSKAHIDGADLTGAKLSKADFRDSNLQGAKIRGADMREANLCDANLRGVDLRDSDLSGADLRDSDLSRADLRGTNLSDSDLRRADLIKADLSGAILLGANLIGTNLKSAHLTGCRIYGISAWNLKINGETQQSNLIITPSDEPGITVDNLEVAQFIYLLLHNDKVRHVIDTITSKVVLIVGRFLDERSKVLEAIKDELRKRDYLPILFDFDKPASRDLTETISTLAHMARFIIADITEPRSIPQELERVVPDLPSVPIQPLLLEGAPEYDMFDHFKNYPWVLAIHRYKNLNHLLSSIREKVIEPAEAKVKDLRGGKEK